MKNIIANFLKESVEQLIILQEGCCHYKIDDHLAICVGWSAGYGDEIRDDVIQSNDNLDYGINAGIKVWTSDASMLTDYDWINFPYYKDGEVLEMDESIEFNTDYNQLALTLLKWYDEIKNIVLSDTGKILKDDRYNR